MVKCSNKNRVTKRIKKTRLIYALPTKDPFQIRRHIQMESEGMEEDIPCKYKQKES